MEKNQHCLAPVNAAVTKKGRRALARRERGKENARRGAVQMKKVSTA
jgi:hypothetical protein